MTRVWICLALAASAAAPAVAQTPAAANLDFEAPALAGDTGGWVCPTAGYAAETCNDRPKQGERCAKLASTSTGERSPFGNLMQAWDATPYRGQRIRVRAAVRTELAAAKDRAKIWLRVDLAGDKMGFFDNMGKKKIAAPDWQYHEIVGQVAPDAQTINFGVMLLQRGTVWIDDVTIETLPPVKNETGALNTDSVDGLMAFARLLAYVRFFHPSDQVAGTNWDAFAIAAIPRVEAARDPAGLAIALESIFRPIAPTVRVYVTSAARPQPDVAAPKDLAGVELIRWEHRGVGLGEDHSIYSSKRVRAPADQPRPDEFADPLQPFRGDLPGGVSCSVPLTLYASKAGTLPETAAPAAVDASASHSAAERATRMAAVALAWGVFQHFYPYFDVVETDWEAALPTALTAAAADADERAFLSTLRRLVAQLHDGHGNVYHACDMPRYTLPLAWCWVGEELIVTHVATADADGPQRGDVVVAIDGKPVSDRRATLTPMISAATPQWREACLLGMLKRSDGSGQTTLTLRGPDGTQRTVRTERLTVDKAVAEPRPEKLTELKAGIMYVDLSRITDADFNAALDLLTDAKGVIFDLRGYPSNISPVALQHLMRETGTCAQWHVPIVRRPDRADMTFDVSNWPVPPMSPRLPGKIAFLTDGRAISYAETYLGIVEAYQLGAIVGGATAGTNGNVNPITLPGGYDVAWTGMKVLKHDGTRHHGVGIQPTVPVSRTIAGIAAGRDEVLEKAIEVVSE